MEKVFAISTIDLVLISTCLIQFALIQFLVFRLGKTSDRKQLHLRYFEDVVSNDGYFKKSYNVILKGQLYLGNVPVGAATILAEQATSSIDKDAVDQVKQDLIKSVSMITGETVKRIVG